MPLPFYRLRRSLVLTAVLFSAVVAGTYFYARARERNVLKEVPNKIAYGIKQTASGFQFSKSDGGRTLFTIRAANIKEFELNGRAELHKVSILLYGHNYSRFDQISGDDFFYDPKSGDITAKGAVEIDLQANPAGRSMPDQAPPKDLQNPIHLKTSDLVFNQESGNASTNARVDFRTPQATGWALGVQYAGRSNMLTLSSQVHLFLSGPNPSAVYADRGVVTSQPHQIVLDNPVLHRGGGFVQGEHATLFLGPDNSVERVLANGNINATEPIAPKRDAATSGTSTVSSPSGELAANQKDSGNPGKPLEMHARSDQAELLFTSTHNQLRTAILTGNVQAERPGPQSMQGAAGRAVLDFSGKSQLDKVHAADGVRLTQHTVKPPSVKPSTAESPAVKSPNSAPNTTAPPQDYEVTAPIIDFFVKENRFLDRAVTSGAAKITIFPAETGDSAAAQNSAPKSPTQRTVVTAGKFNAKFGRTPQGRSSLATIHGAPDAKIVNTSPGQPDRVSTSRTLDTAFLPQGGIDSILQQGNFAYTDNLTPDKRTQAWADRARYTPADQIISLVGNPRIVDGSTATTSKVVRINRATGEAYAEDDVKSTYSELKEQPSGALLASSSPIHVTSHSMAAHKNSGLALYTGDARLWQDANIIEAPFIQFDRDHRSVTAQGTTVQPVSTLLIQSDNQADNAQPEKKQGESTKAQSSSAKKPEKFTPVAITSSHLTYVDADRKARYEGNVLAKGLDFTGSADAMDVYLLPRSQTSANQSLTGPGQLDHIVGQGHVVVHEAARRADGQQLVYTAADDKFVLTGGPPSIFDAERGRTTGLSLTFFRRDDRVLVEGKGSSPAVTQTRVAR